MSLKNLNMKVSILDELKIPYYVKITKGRKLSIKYDKIYIQDKIFDRK